MKNKMKKALNKQNKQSKQTKTEESKQKRIPGSVIFHPYHFRKIDKSGIIKKLTAKQLKYRIKEALKEK